MHSRWLGTASGVAPDASAADVAAVKKDYFESPNTIAGAWGGTLEMCLLSHARGGEVAFRVIDYARRKTEYYCSLPEGDAATRIEIPLHHCRQDGDDRPQKQPNHWAAFEYCMADGSTRHFLAVLRGGDSRREGPSPAAAALGRRHCGCPCSSAGQG